MEITLIKWYVEELNKGSHSAFNAIYDIYADRLYGFALAHTKSEDLAKDIVQESFLKLWMMREDLNSEKSIKALLFTMCNNRIIDLFRSQINKCDFESYMLYLDDVMYSENTVERAMYYDEFLQILEKSKKDLPNRQLQIFEMSREKGLSINEIATELEISPQTVKNQLSTALRIVRCKLNKYTFLFSFFLFFKK